MMIQQEKLLGNSGDTLTRQQAIHLLMQCRLLQNVASSPLLHKNTNKKNSLGSYSKILGSKIVHANVL